LVEKTGWQGFRDLVEGLLDHVKIIQHPFPARETGRSLDGTDLKNALASRKACSSFAGVPAGRIFDGGLALPCAFRPFGAQILLAGFLDLDELLRME